MKERYSDADMLLMQRAEESLERGASRLVEIRNFAIRAGYKKIGLAHCMAVTKEADAVAEFLGADFEVARIDCKTGRVPKAEMLDMANAAGISCNPLGQADYLAKCGAEMNIVMGLCVGHDMLFTANSGVPTTTLLVKDRKHRHNPLEGIKEIE